MLITILMGQLLAQNTPGNTRKAGATIFLIVGEMLVIGMGMLQMKDMLQTATQL